jgi:rubrerythrin
MSTLSAQTVLQWAMEIERNGEAFYRTVAAASQDREVRNLLQDLAHQEGRHYRTFERMLADAPTAPAEEAAADNDRAYLETALAGALLGPDKGLERARQAQTEEQALRAALAFEKDTLLFFYELAEAVPESQLAAVRAVIDEERDHLHQIARVLQSGPWVP